MKLRSALSVLIVATLVLTGAVAPSLLAPAAAQRPEDSASFMSQFPESDVYRVQVIGDAFAEGLVPVLADVLAPEQRLQVIRKHRPIGALVRLEWEEDAKAEEANREAHPIVVIMTGLSDKQTMRPATGARQLAIGSDDWKDEYGRRFERLLRAVKKRNTAVYVIGQPILRRPSENTQAEVLSDIMRQRAAIVGAKFIDIYETFQDDGGGFSQFGPDFNGNRVKLREGDGITLTTQGNRKLALVLEKELKRDVAQAASDRAIPLAGDEAEQKRIVPARAASGSAKGVPSARGVLSQVPVAPAGDGTDQKADNGRLTLKSVTAAGREETATIEIVRPAIPGAVIALLNRREAAAGDRAQASSEGVVEDVGGGLTVVNSVASLGDITAQQAGTRRKAPVTQSAFYQVLIKGERMPPQPGRADDFTWPRPDPFAQAAPAQAAPQPQIRQAAPQAQPVASPSKQPSGKPAPPAR